MIRALAIIYGIVFLVLGIIGFAPEWIPPALFSKLALKKMTLLSALFIGTGAWGFIVGWVGFGASRFFFQVTGIFYAILAILGFVYAQRPIFDLLPNTRPHTWFYVIVALTSLIFGFGSKGEQ